ncbi:hypothetical protein B0H17DRAFT_1138175 [Mycena rosella]|uniref:Uncharacterized protein n=1 Tax=Mycena rosella TaxID=1033263 RepID=A0AAD7D7E1_MYCRO|nr:hypothetical protein B0H17DRAFT_1138175 [Mycena rosella]
MTTWFPEGYPSQPRVFFPPGPPPLSAATSNPNPPPWRYRPRQASGTGTRSGGSGTSSDSRLSGASEPVPHMHSRNNSGYPQLDLTDGVDYFKIGDLVRIRRWAAATDSYSDWITGRIVRPVLSENEDRSQRRSYLVAYENPHSKELKERQFSPHFQEITSLEADPVSATPNLRLNDKSNIVFAPIPVTDADGKVKRIIYSPAIILTSPNEQGGVRLRVLAGPAAKREISNFLVKHSPPYTVASAQMLKQKGFRVEGDGINRSF